MLVLIDKTNIRTISNIYLFDNEGLIISSFKDEKLDNYSKPNDEIFKELDKNQVYILIFLYLQEDLS